MSHATRKRWLKVSAIVIAGFAPLLFLAAIPGFAAPVQITLDILAWPFDGSPAFDGDGMRFLSALSGGFLLGWGVMVWMLAGRVYDADPDGVRRALLVSAGAWFVLDSAGSILAGAASNAAFNIVILLLVVGPFWWPVGAEPEVA